MNRKQRRAEHRAEKKKGRKSGSDLDRLKHDYSLAVEHHREGRLAKAEAVYRKVLAADPNIPLALLNLSVLVLQNENYAEALELTQHLITIQPDNPGAYNNRGSALRHLGRFQEAVSCYRQSLEINPADPQTYFNIGNTYREMDQLDEALSNFREAIGLNPRYLDARVNIGTILLDQEHFEDAAACFRELVSQEPGFAEAHNNLGVTFQKLADQEEAVIHFKNALTINTDYTDAHYNLGVSYEKSGKLKEALESYQKAVSIEPDNAEAQFAMSNVFLAQGDLKKGWEQYEWRWKKKLLPTLPRHFPQPRWTGEDLKGKSILLWGEQGIGDEIRFASLIPDVMSLGARCTVECEPRLLDLFARSFPAVRFCAYPFKEAESGAEAFDFQIPMPSLPAHFRPTLADFPDRRSYMVVEEEKRQQWHDRISSLGDGLKIGISWRSGLDSPYRRVTFAEIPDFEPLLSIKEAVFVNLQYDECADDIAKFNKEFGVPLHAWDDIDLKNDIDGAMALTSNLDIVVTLMSAVYEMGGSLGIPTYVFHPSSACSFSLGTKGVPFHPSVRMYQSKIGENWESTMHEIKRDIEELTN